MSCSEPMHDNTPRTTATSAEEGRLKVSVGGGRGRRAYLRKKVREYNNKR